MSVKVDGTYCKRSASDGYSEVHYPGFQQGIAIYIHCIQLKGFRGAVILLQTLDISPLVFAAGVQGITSH
jgi:hypothetical protein